MFQGTIYILDKFKQLPSVWWCQTATSPHFQHNCTYLTAGRQDHTSKNSPTEKLSVMALWCSEDVLLLWEHCELWCIYCLTEVTGIKTLYKLDRVDINVHLLLLFTTVNCMTCIEPVWSHLTGDTIATAPDLSMTQEWTDAFCTGRFDESCLNSRSRKWKRCQAEMFSKC